MSRIGGDFAGPGILNALPPILPARPGRAHKGRGSAIPSSNFSPSFRSHMMSLTSGLNNIYGGSGFRSVRESLILKHGSHVDFKARKYLGRVPRQTLINDVRRDWESNTVHHPITIPEELVGRRQSDNILLHWLDRHGYYVAKNRRAWTVKNSETRKLLKSSTLSLSKVLRGALRKLHRNPDEIVDRRGADQRFRPRRFNVRENQARLDYAANRRYFREGHARARALREAARNA